MHIATKAFASTLLTSFISISLVGCGSESESIFKQNTQLAMNAGLLGGPPSAEPNVTVTSFPGLRNHYTITRTATGYAVTDIIGSGGTVNLINQTSASF